MKLTGWLSFIMALMLGVSAGAFLGAGPAMAERLRVAVTTSFQNSGLSDVLLPKIERDLGFSIDLLVVGTGQALKLGELGDVDAILVHSKPAEDAFVDAGFAPYRREIMYNDFVIVGPQSDPARVSAATGVGDAFLRIAAHQSLFISRGDESGTHQRELRLWDQAGVSRSDLATPWYAEIGAGMGAALNMAAARGAYVLSDRASWLKFGNKGTLSLLFFGGAELRNQYAFLPVSVKRHPHVEIEKAKALEAWLVSPRGQTLIANYQIEGQALFVPNADK